MSALTVPFGPTVRLPLVSCNLPSTGPSTIKSSLPVISPLIRMPWPIEAAPREAGGAAGAFWLELGPKLVEDSGTPGRGSSFFHILGHSEYDFCSKVANFGLVWVQRLRKAKIVQHLQGVKGNGR